MQPFTTQIFDAMHTFATQFFSNPNAIPYLAGAVLVIIVAAAVHYVMSAPTRAAQRVAELVYELNAATRMLSEAEHIGKFGSFTWNFENPPASSWSHEMFELCGLVPRKKPPTIEAVVERAHEQDREEVKKAFLSAQTQPGPFSFSFRAVAPSGQMRYLRVEGTTTLSGDRKPFLIKGVAHDVTKEMEVDKAKTEFVSLASHQLKTPLTAIKWISESLLKQSETLSQEQVGYLTKIQDESRRMMEMINDILNISRIELGRLSIQPEDIDINELATTVVQEQQHTADEKHVALKFSCDASLPHMWADKGLVRMVIQNLISNAIKYTPNGGSVECEMTPGGASRETVFIRVADTGIGIPKAEQDRVFEKLHRASNARALVPDGTGLGLYVLKIIADRVAGSVTFESVEGKGTTFYVSLPLDWHGKEIVSQA